MLFTRAVTTTCTVDSVRIAFSELTYYPLEITVWKLLFTSNEDMIVEIVEITVFSFSPLSERK